MMPLNSEKWLELRKRDDILVFNKARYHYISKIDLAIHFRYSTYLLNYGPSHSVDNRLHPPSLSSYMLKNNAWNYS